MGDGIVEPETLNVKSIVEKLSVSTTSGEDVTMSKLRRDVSTENLHMETGLGLQLKVQR